jgi:hypothetical protein
MVVVVGLGGVFSMRISVLHALKKLCLFAALLTMIVPRTATAQALAELPGRNDINSWTVGLAGGLLEGSYIRYAADLARAQ